MWHMSNAQALIFIAVVVIAVVLWTGANAPPPFFRITTARCLIQIKPCSEIGKIELPSVRHDFFRPCREGIMKDLDVQDLLRAIGSTPGSRSAAPPTPASSLPPSRE